MTLTNDELTELLDRLLAGWENEVVEFKEAARQFSADKIGEYVSALSNEANLRGLASGWLVFGVSNTRQVVGTTHLIDVQQRQTLKHHIHQSIDQGLTVHEVYEIKHSGMRVVLLEVPAAPRGIPISRKGDYRARVGESLVPLSLDKLDEIRQQTISTDWTVAVVLDATLAHLDPTAITRALDCTDFCGCGLGCLFLVCPAPGRAECSWRPVGVSYPIAECRRFVLSYLSTHSCTPRATFCTFFHDRW